MRRAATIAKEARPDPSRSRRRKTVARRTLRRTFAPGPVFWLRTRGRSPSHPADSRRAHPDSGIRSTTTAFITAARPRRNLTDFPTCRRGTTATTPRANCRPRARAILNRGGASCKGRRMLPEFGYLGQSFSAAPGEEFWGVAPATRYQRAFTGAGQRNFPVARNATICWTECSLLR
jgi:hypothetical protein